MIAQIYGRLDCDTTPLFLTYVNMGLQPTRSTRQQQPSLLLLSVARYEGQ